MGLISGLLSAPVVAPARGLLFVFDKIREAVDAEMWDAGRLEGALVRLSLQLDLGEISETEYNDAERSILEQLSAVRKHNESLGAASSTRKRSGRSKR